MGHLFSVVSQKVCIGPEILLHMSIALGYPQEHEDKSITRRS